MLLLQYVASLSRNICGIIIGEVGSIEEAKKQSANMKDCPHLVFSGTVANRIYSVYIVPEDKMWWLGFPEDNPKAVGFDKASVHIIEELMFPEKFDLRLPKNREETAPCGADCRTCPLRREYNCKACPATVHYKAK